MAKTTKRPGTKKTRAARTESRDKRQPVSVAIVNRICDEIAMGATLTEICARTGMPPVHQFYRAVNQTSALRSRLARAREDAAERMADEIRAIADDTSEDWTLRTRPNGQVVPALNDEHVRRSQLRIQTRQWLLSKMMPARFGDRVETQLSGPGGGPVLVEASISARMLASLDQLRARLPSPEPTTIDGETDKE